MWDSWLRPIIMAHDPSTATSFWIKSLVAMLDRSLCLVRALQFYMSRTDLHRAGRKPLFLPLRETASRKLSPNMILAWLKKAINFFSLRSRRKR